MFFPRLYHEKRQKKGPVPLREEQNQLFFDGFIRPSIEKIGPHFVHHVPGSYDSVQAASRIARESSGLAAVRGAAFEVPYSEENLPRLWSVMQEALDRAERDMAADGLRRGGGGGSVQETEDAMEDDADSDWDDETGSIQEDEEREGKSDRGGDGQAPGGRGSEEDQAAGEGWKPPRIPRAITTEYPVHMLRDSICITLEPRRTSPIFRRGVSYVQSYTVEEGNFNVAAVWAFSHPNIFNLAHSDEAWATVARKGNIKASRQDAERALSQSIQRMTSNLEDSSRGYGWRIELRAIAVRPDRDAFYVLAAADFNAFVRQNIDKHLRLMDYIMSYWARDPCTPQSAASLYAIVTLALRHFISHQPHALARILSAPLTASTRGKIGLGMARSREQRGFAFFPKDVVDWHDLRLHDWATELLQVPQLVIKAHWLEEASLRQSRHLIDQVISLAISKDIRTREQAEDMLGILSQLLIRSYKEAAYLALFPAKGRKKRVPDIDAFKFTLAGMRAESRAVQGRDCNPLGNHHFFIKHISTYFA
ncbi:hypothetical protein F53441_12412 [Fusarium austroafricanum]|uniref:Uncharacterized protein n=1 Tax=Fusarium austroafricanum TaxID=2364996 RepID=A0A8H4NQ18_9HYPO|nr:hypothetical protein F53441_12412 [Fusarium austroafricanum]